jgi:hypothetical protein
MPNTNFTRRREKIQLALFDRLRRTPIVVSPDALLRFLEQSIRDVASGIEPTSFYEKVIVSELASKPRLTQKTVRMLEAMLFELETGLRSCFHSTTASSLHRGAFLDYAELHVRRFDNIFEKHQRDRLGLTEGRRKGGKARHAKNDSARRRAARLLMAMKPEGGWTHPALAARHIEPRLIAFIKKRKLGIVCEDHLRRTIVRWILNFPPVRSAYQATRREQH